MPRRSPRRRRPQRPAGRTRCALCRNSSTGSRPTATRTVSQSNRFSVPGIGRHFSSISRDRDRLHFVLALGAQDRCARCRPARPSAPACPCGPCSRRTRAAPRTGPTTSMPGLQGVVAGDQAHVAAADDEQPLGRPDQVAVDQRLEGARAVDARQGVAREDQRFLARARRDQQDVGLDDEVLLVVAQDADVPVAEHRQRGGVQPDPARSRTAAPRCLQLGGDVDAARAGVDGVDRAEEAVRLQHQLAAQAVLVVDEQRADARLAQLDRRGQARRAAADDQALDVHGLDRVACAAGPARRAARAGRRAAARACPGGPATMQDLTGRPSARTMHCAHWPLAQKMPCGEPSFGWWPKIRTPLANSADAMVSPSRASSGWPCHENVTPAAAGAARIGCS